MSPEFIVRVNLCVLPGGVGREKVKKINLVIPRGSEAGRFVESVVVIILAVKRENPLLKTEAGFRGVSFVEIYRLGGKFSEAKALFFRHLLF